MAGEALPVVDPADFPAGRPRAGASVWGVVLAAGTSSRYGAENKLLATVDGRPLVVHAVETLAESDLAGVTVVVGWDSAAVRSAIADVPVEILDNPDYDAGQSTSVRRGVRSAVDQGADAVLIALGDMPAVDPATVDLLVEAYERGVGDALAAAHDGSRGNPVLFDARFFDRLAALDGDTGGRGLLLDGDDAVAVETGDPGTRRDVDRPADLPADE